MNKIVLLTVAALLAMACTVSALDGTRRGFILGGALGVAPVVKWEGKGQNVPTDYDETKAGIVVDVIVGLSWSEHNMIVLDIDLMTFQSTALEVGNIKPTVFQGFSGFSWYHYFGPTGKSWFTTVGLGTYDFMADWEDDNVTVHAKNDDGFGWMVGGGYEFSRHWQIAARLSFGKTSEPGIDYDHMHFAVTVGAVAF
jgi:hypothetical protein